jgi:hypothetical protein
MDEMTRLIVKTHERLQSYQKFEIDDQKDLLANF